MKVLLFNLLLSKSYYFHFLYLIQTDRQSPCNKASSKIKNSPCKYQINYDKNSLIRCHLNCTAIHQRVFEARICSRIGNKLESLKIDNWKTSTLFFEAPRRNLYSTRMYVPQVTSLALEQPKKREMRTSGWRTLHHQPEKQSLSKKSTICSPIVVVFF